MFKDALLVVTLTAEFVLALLGTIIALQAEWAKARRWWILGTFFVVGLAGVVATLKTGQQSAVANSKLSTSIDKVQASTAEIDRVTKLNTSLQEKLLASSDTIAKLSEETLLQATGSKGYCYLSPTLMENAAGLPLVVIGSKYPVYDAKANIIEQSVGESPETAIQRFKNPLAVLSLGTVSGNYVRFIGYNLPVQRGKNNRYQINIYSRAALFTEYLVVTWNNGQWHIGIDLGRNGTNNKWIKKIPKDFPYLEEPIH